MAGLSAHNASQRPDGLSDSEPDWRDRFCGRETELASLRAAYAAAASGDGPRMVVILGDRGMGKTRLALEFYADLTRRHDPEGYWPASSIFRGRNLLVAPDVERDPAVREHFASFALAERRMPFLWWGFRLSDPEDRNAIPTDLATHRRFLSLHLEPIRHRKRLQENTRAIADVGVDAGRGGLMKLVEMIPFVGPGLGLLIEGADLSRRAAKLGLERRELQRAHAATRIEDVARTGAGTLIDETLAELEALFAADSDEVPIPLVIFVDDAQFARPGGDEGALTLLETVWARATERRWPLLLIAAHWELEWRNSDPAAEERDFAGVFRPLLTTEPIVLGREPDLAELVRAGLTGLPADDTELLLRRADGNPQLLIEIIERVRRSPAWRSSEGPLTSAGRRHLETASFDLHNLIRQRLEGDGTPEEVRRAVAISAVQGVEFSCAIAEAAGEVLHAEAVRRGLAEAEDRHRYVEGVTRGVAVFIQRAYRDAALSLVDGQFGSQEDVTAALIGAADRFISDPAKWESLPDVERDAVLALRASLGERDPEREARLRAADAIIRLVMRAMQADGSVPDLARAAFWAKRLAVGLEDGRWAADDLDLEALSWAHAALDRWNGAGVALPLAVALAGRLRDALPAEADESAVNDLAHTLWKVVEGARLNGRIPDAVAAAAEAYDLVATLHARAPKRSTATLLGAALERRAEQRRLERDYEGYTAALREWVEITRRLADEDPTDRVCTANAVLAALALSRWLEDDRGPTDEAWALLAEAYERQARLPDGPADMGELRRYAATLLEFAKAAKRRGDLDGAATTSESVVESVRTLFELEPSQEHRIALHSTLRYTADIRWARGDAAQAIDLLCESAALLEAVSPPPDLAHAFRQADTYLGLAACAQGIAHGAAGSDDAIAVPLLGSTIGGATIADLLRALLDRARGLLGVDRAPLEDFAEIAGRLAAELEWGTVPQPEVAASLEAEVREVLRTEAGEPDRLAPWYQGKLMAIECLATGARNRGKSRRVAELHEIALRQALEFAEEIDDESAFGDLLYWITAAGHEILAVDGRLEPDLVRSCAALALRPRLEDETPENASLRSSALSMLATLGADIPAPERDVLLDAASEWFGTDPSRLAILAGYEAEIECEAIDATPEQRCAQLAEFAEALAEVSDPEAASPGLEWRFLWRLQRKWGCGGGAVWR